METQNRVYRSIIFGVGMLLCAVLLFPANGCRKSNTDTVSGHNPAVITTKMGVEMVLIPAGYFEMGSEQPDESPRHRVWVDSFLMDRYEVTQELYDRFPLPDPSHFKNPKNPVDQINWKDALEFCNMRSRKEGLTPCYDLQSGKCNYEADGYRLPTEAEWEYACRSGSNNRYAYGNEQRRLKNYAWFEENSGGRTHPVGRKKPNNWGLYDMLGNTAEWCQDYYDKNYYQNSPTKNPHGPASGEKRVLRGGSWKSKAQTCGCSFRFGDESIEDTCLASDTIGFRCVRRAVVKTTPQKQ